MSDDWTRRRGGNGWHGWKIREEDCNLGYKEDTAEDKNREARVARFVEGVLPT